MPPDYVQNSVTQAPVAGMPGQEYGSGGLRDAISRPALEDIPFGSFVKVTPNGVELADDAGEVTGLGRGVALQIHTIPTGQGYKTGDMVSVLTVGKVYVQCEDAVTAYATPYVRFSGTGTKGQFRGANDAGNVAQPSGIRFYSTVGAAGVAIVDLLPVATGAAGPTGPSGPTGPTGA